MLYAYHDWITFFPAFFPLFLNIFIIYFHFFLCIIQVTTFLSLSLGFLFFFFLFPFSSLFLATKFFLIQANVNIEHFATSYEAFQILMTTLRTLT